MFKNTVSAIALATAIAAPSIASASMARVTTDLNLRAGPGPNFEVTGTIDSQDTIDVRGCTTTGNWCQVSYQGKEGWAYAGYIAYDMEGKTVVLPEARTTVEVPTVEYEGSGGAVVGAAGGAIAGALIAGPVGAAVGGVTGLAAGSIIDPPTHVKTYVEQNGRDYVYLDGEVVVGARVPDSVEIHAVPDYDYNYAYINGVRVLVEPNDRSIVYIYR